MRHTIEPAPSLGDSEESNLEAGKMSRDLQAVSRTVRQPALIAELHAIWVHLDFIRTIVATSRLILVIVFSSAFSLPLLLPLRHSPLRCVFPHSSTHSVRVRELPYRKPSIERSPIHDRGKQPGNPSDSAMPAWWVGRSQAPDAHGARSSIWSA